VLQFYGSVTEYHISQACTNFPNSRGHLKILGIRCVTCSKLYTRAGEQNLWARAHNVYNLEETLSRTHGNFKSKISSWGSSIIINSHGIIIIAYSNCIINARIITIFLIKASSRNVTRKKKDCCYFLFKKQTVKRSVQCHVFAHSPPDRRPNDK